MEEGSHQVHKIRHFFYSFHIIVLKHYSQIPLFQFQLSNSSTQWEYQYSTSSILMICILIPSFLTTGREGMGERGEVIPGRLGECEGGSVSEWMPVPVQGCPVSFHGSYPILEQEHAENAGWFGLVIVVEWYELRCEEFPHTQWLPFSGISR